MRNIENDEKKIEEYWDMDVIEDGDDIQEILEIAEYWINQYKKLTKKEG